MKSTPCSAAASCLGVMLALSLAGCGSSGSNPQFSGLTQLQQGGVVGKVELPTGDTAQGGHGETIDGIVSEIPQTGYHIHAHLSLYVNGQQIAIPEAIGIVNPINEQNGFVEEGDSFYWLHTHDATGIIHVEAPGPGTYTLGQFFDIWGQPLSSTNVAGFQGPVTAMVQGLPYTGDLRAITFIPHQQITLEVGTPVVTPPLYAFPPDY
ncbi:MAG TPA: hypothetical protein VFJ58_26575 [Armatimonadota bacterium]|nr:hypothetical protein [Armatimonadota bacterium]